MDEKDTKNTYSSFQIVSAKKYLWKSKKGDLIDTNFEKPTLLPRELNEINIKKRNLKIDIKACFIYIKNELNLIFLL